MGNLKKKGKSGTAVSYINRAQACKRLQLSLADFRRLCILKGIYPREPKHRNKLDKGKKDLPRPQTYFLTKDITFLSHEPLIDKFRQMKTILRKLKCLKEKREYMQHKALQKHMPKFLLQSIIKERYPTFQDALVDLDDALTLCFLFSTMPTLSLIKDNSIQNCRRLTIEFMFYVMKTKSLRKVFISIKGIYYQACIQGITITWIIPHKFTYTSDPEVDLKIMGTFLSFYTQFIGFTNYKLYTDINIFYPPKFSCKFACEDVKDEMDYYSTNEASSERMATFNDSLLLLNSDLPDQSNADMSYNIDEFPPKDENDLTEWEKARKEAENLSKFINLFKDLKFFLNREVPLESLSFIIKCFGGQVSWSKTLAVNSKFDEDDKAITHQIVDRPNFEKKYPNRFYIQPQWIYDCVNNQTLLPVQDYFIGAKLPPHFSPFVPTPHYDESILEQEVLARKKPTVVDAKNNSSHKSAFKETVFSDSSKSKCKMAVKRSKLEKREEKVVDEFAIKKGKALTKEEQKLAEMMIPKKQKRLYDKIRKSEKRKKNETLKLLKKRQNFQSQV